MTVELIQHQELPAFIESPIFRSDVPLPISRRRAISHYHNPRAIATDVVLVMILEKDTMLGYLGLIPDLLFINDREERITWMSCIWVSPAARGKGIAKRLLKAAYEAWEGRLIATEFTGPAKHLYDKTGYFKDLATLHGQRFYLRSNLSVLLPPKRTVFQKGRFVLTAIDGIINFFNDLRLKLFFKPLSPSISFQKIKTPTQAHQSFLSDFKQETFTRRGLAELQWLSEHPWLGSELADKQDQAHYAFSVFAKQFFQQWYAIFDQEKLVGLVLFSIRDQQLKVPYYFVKSGYHEAVVQHIIREMIQQKINILTCYHPQLCKSLQAPGAPFYYKKPFMREYLIAKVFFPEKAEQGLGFQDGDGDCGFT